MILINASQFTAWAVLLTGLGTVTLFQIGPLHFRPYQIPLLLSLGVVFFQFMLNLRKLYIPSTIFFTLLVLMMSICLSFINARFPLLALKQTILLLLFLTLFFLIINTCNTKEKLIFLQRLIVMAAFGVCLYGIFLLVKENLPGIPKAGGYLFTRPKSFFEEANEFGLYLVFVFSYVFSQIIAPGNKQNKLILWSTFLMSIFLLVTNMSRGAWIGILAAISIIYYFYHKTEIKKINFKLIKKISIISIILVLLSLLISPKLMHLETKVLVQRILYRSISLFSGTDATFLIRLNANTQTFNAMLEHPYIGVGFGNVGILFEQGELSGNLPNLIRVSSNLLCELGAETGLLGFFSFIGFIFGVMFKGFNNIINTKEIQIKIIFINAFASFVGIVINGMAFSSHLLPFLWISAGILCIKEKEC